MCGVLGAVECIESVGETIGDDQGERYSADYSVRRLRFKQDIGRLQVEQRKLLLLFHNRLPPT